MKCVIHGRESQILYTYLGVDVPSCGDCLDYDCHYRHPVWYRNEERQLKDFAVDVLKGLVSLEDNHGYNRTHTLPE
jgi:hypothetical protein